MGFKLRKIEIIVSEDLSPCVVEFDSSSDEYLVKVPDDITVKELRDLSEAIPRAIEEINI